MMANYGGNPGVGSRSFHDVVSVVGGSGMRSSVFSPMVQLGNVSGAAVSGGGVPVSFAPVLSGAGSGAGSGVGGGVDLGMLPSVVGLPAAGMVGSGQSAAGDVMGVLGSLSPEVLMGLVSQLMAGSGSGGSGVPVSGVGSVGSSEDMERMIGRRVLELLVSQGGLEKLMGLKQSGGVGGAG